MLMVMRKCEPALKPSYACDSSFMVAQEDITVQTNSISLIIFNKNIKINSCH